jgi:circadian clock protein KaiB
MNPPSAEPLLEGFQRALSELETEPLALTLFVSGASDFSALAISNIRRICDSYLAGRYHLDIVDLNQEPDLAAEHQVLATPTLVKDHPLPTCILVGDMSDHVRILLALDVTRTTGPPSAVSNS